MKNSNKFLIALGIVLAMLASTVEAKDLCAKSKSGCYIYQFSGVPMKPLQTMGWRISCTPDYPFYYQYEDNSDDYVHALRAEAFVNKGTSFDTVDFNVTNFTLFEKVFGLRFSCSKYPNE